MLNTKPTFVPNPNDVKGAVRKAWKMVKNKVNESEIIHISIERQALEITDGFEIPEPVDTSIFEVKIICRD